MGNDYAGIKPTSDTWNADFLRNEKKMLPAHCLEKIITGCRLHVAPPDRLLRPEALQRFLESLGPA